MPQRRSGRAAPFALLAQLPTMLWHVRCALFRRELLKVVMHLGVPVVPKFSLKLCDLDLSLLSLRQRASVRDRAKTVCEKRRGAVW